MAEHNFCSVHNNKHGDDWHTQPWNNPHRFLLSVTSPPPLPAFQSTSAHPFHRNFPECQLGTAFPFLTVHTPEEWIIPCLVLLYVNCKRFGPNCCPTWIPFNFLGPGFFLPNKRDNSISLRFCT